MFTLTPLSDPLVAGARSGDRVGDDAEGGSCRPQRRAGDRPPLVASLASAS